VGLRPTRLPPNPRFVERTFPIRANAIPLRDDQRGNGGEGDNVIITHMRLTIEEVEHIAELARLKLSEEEINRFREQLSDILDYAARLQSLDTSGIAPTSSVLPERSVLRPDEVQPSLSLEELLNNAPDTEKGQFRVPPVLE
jgi:aspartyl-tRNA(Asn)/glutamyl-tRNA(Gln) amidotransferase subunit C